MAFLASGRGFFSQFNGVKEVIIFEFAKYPPPAYLLEMSIWVPVISSVVIVAFSVTLLRISGVWGQIFAPRDLRPEETFDPLVAAPLGWIENHEFWDNDQAREDSETTEPIDFWEAGSKRYAS